MLSLSGRAFITLPVLIVPFISLPASSSPFRHLVNLGYIDAGSGHLTLLPSLPPWSQLDTHHLWLPLLKQPPTSFQLPTLLTLQSLQRDALKHNQNLIKNCSFHAKCTCGFLAVSPLSVPEWVLFCFLLVTLSLIIGSSIQTTPASRLFSQQPICILPMGINVILSLLLSL